MHHTYPYLNMHMILQRYIIQRMGKCLLQPKSGFELSWVLPHKKNNSIADEIDCIFLYDDDIVR